MWTNRSIRRVCRPLHEMRFDLGIGSRLATPLRLRPAYRKLGWNPTDISHLPDLKQSSYRNGLRGSSGNVRPRFESRPFARSIVEIVHLTPPEQRFRPVSAQHQPLAPLESPTFRSVTSVSHAAPTAAARRSLDKLIPDLNSSVSETYGRWERRASGFAVGGRLHALVRAQSDPVYLLRDS